MNENLYRAQYLTFVVGDDEYALPILRVKEIIEFGGLTRVPSMPPYIRGVINLRGSVVPVIDLAARFGFEANPVTRTSCIVIGELSVEGERIVMGMIADAVRQVVELDSAEVEAPPAFGTRARPDFLLGMGLVNNNLVLLLNVDTLL